ncbi:hypothetical protein [Escherichia phage EC150]|uniref:Peptidase S74 domain-containing protein n=1 Tax=Escherichia phage EC150 TaxID=2936907 RepID=A0A9E7LKE0_9CAUD|nr:hypothetical protein [Escherichia phage EC150]
MPRLIFKNNFEVALAQPTTTSDTTITIRSGSGFPTLAANERVVATIVDAATGLQFEIVTVTAVVGNVLTVQRAQEGTAARAWAAGDMLSIRTTAATLTGTVRNFGEIPNGINLNALTGSWFGQYYQPNSLSASPALNYPTLSSGVLEVIQISANACSQKYTATVGPEYNRVFNGDFWSPWKKVYSELDVVPVANGGTGQSTIQGMKSAFGFGQVADQNIVPTSMGGTGSGDNAQAWLNIRPTGPTPLAGDPVNDYDAATKRWVENLINTGTVGPNMNGVMNYGVGDFHLRDSRAYIQPYEVVADGQLLNRADWPELWAYAQMLTPIADADWLADPTKRGKYSLGNGSTTFRVPDKNGVQVGSLAALYGRGDGAGNGTANSNADGVVFDSAAPNIYGDIGGVVAYGQTGAIVPGQVETPLSPEPVTGNGVIRVSFDASRVSPVYGRSNSEIMGRNFVGVWVIRASGGFAAANTTWSVINGDAVKPATGTLVSGGSVKSEYKIGTNIAYQAFLQAYGKIDGLTSEQGAVISNGVQEWKFAQDGTFYFPNSINQISTERTDGALNVNAYLRPKDLVVQPLNSVGVSAYESNGMRMINFNQSTPGYVSYFSGDWYAGSYTFGGVRGTGTDLMHAQISINNGQGAAADFKFMPDGTATAGNWVSTSDERVKTNIQRISDPLGKMRLIKGVTWERLDKSEKPNGIGFIAQDVEGVFPDAVKTLKYSNTELKDGTVVEDIKSVDTYGVAAALHHEAILALMDQIDELKAEIAVLKSAK